MEDTGDSQSQRSQIRHFKWRSSKWFIISTITLALFSETFLYAFILPILNYMLENRLQIDHSKQQAASSIILAIHGAVSVIAGPIIGRFTDKSHIRKMPLLISLLGCIIGTVLIACAHSILVLLLGRVLQALAGSAAWIIGYATIADTADQRNLPRIMGITMSVVNVAVVGGPAISGLLLDYAGYWMTWLVPLVILVIDLVARVLMVQEPPIHFSMPDTETIGSEEEAEPTETTGLLSSDGDSHIQSTTGFWRVICHDSRVLTVLFLQVSSITVGTCFNATIPLHVQETFGWGPGVIGGIFSCLSLPVLLIGPLAGWVQGRIGAKYPAVVSLILQAGVLILLGLAGTERIPWFSAQRHGGTIYIVSIIAMGVLRPFMTGLGPVELTAAVEDHQEKTPGAFGPEGGLSRVFALVETVSSIGMIIGPMLGGALKELAGYDCMSWTWSRWLALALLYHSNFF
ncbi:Tetracycline resistance protein TetA/multidrug resistance protein MdtG, partial [Penicillium odoratum]|uniref:Tetracycline resistance protein TetA/multidrug resistance protein MdtG n=1 Tax=Penicillium odoratum TaxID=1167516 RepID=UPI00254904AA